jgi:hypothetical protein
VAPSIGNDPLLRWTAVFAGGAGLLLAGCAPGDPLDTKVEASDALGLAMWQSRLASRLTPDQIETMNKALQEMRFHIMSAERTSGSEFIERTLVEETNGRTLREIERLGLGWELERAQAEWAALDDSLIKNSLMTTRPGDTDSADYLKSLHERQVARLHAAAAEVALTKARLAATGQLTGP